MGTQSERKVLVKTQPMSDAVKGITAKFMYIFEAPFLVRKNSRAFSVRTEG